MPDIPIGVKGESQLEVTREEAISFLGDDEARILATPWLIAHLEMTARDTVKPYLLDGQDTVGTQVNLKHLAATPIGFTARFTAEVLEVRDGRIGFRVEAFDDQGKIAEGAHERFVVDISRFVKGLRRKRGIGA